MNQAIFDAAQNVVDHWNLKPGADLANAVQELAAVLDDRPELATEKEIKRAKENYAEKSDDCIEVDRCALASRSDDGVWVQGWLWLQGA